MAATAAQPHDRPARRRPFSSLMRKLANIRGAPSGEGDRTPNPPKRSRANGSNNTKAAVKRVQQFRNNNPYSQAGRSQVSRIPTHTSDSHESFSTARSPRPSSLSTSGAGPRGPGGSRNSDEDGDDRTLDDEDNEDNEGGLSGGGTSPDDPSSDAPRASADDQARSTLGTRSVAWTDHETGRSIAPSHNASTVSRVIDGGLASSRRGGDSTFSSPAPSVRSLTTTLTTIQSTLMPGGNVANGNAAGNHQPAHSNQHQPGAAIIFNQPFPTPASAIPAHLQQPQTGHPTTYATATANNLLTDNASILTLASSSKRRRRRSFDTDASVRALAPSSLFGGSRESLPLSILSANFDGVMSAGGPSTPVTPGALHRGLSNGGLNSELRTSMYSTSGVLLGDRNSLLAKPQSMAAGDGASVRSGLLGHGRADSVTGSLSGGVLPASPLASPLVAEEEEGEPQEVEYELKVVEEPDQEVPGGAAKN